MKRQLPLAASHNRPIVAFGPELPGFGSWEWVGQEMAEELSRDFQTVRFSREIPACDVLVIVKQSLPAAVVEQAARHAAVIYCPIDFYDSGPAIDRDGPMLARCTRIVVHCERLRKYFQSYAPVEYVDHHVRFAAAMREEFVEDGPLLWVGVRTNLPPLVEWVNQRQLPAPLRVLTNHENSAADSRAADFGFQPHNDVVVERWSPETQRRWTSKARVALDIKGQDFRQRHKPPAKALDFLVSGVPLAMNADSSSVDHLARLGFSIAVPDDPDRWLSRAYWEETVRFGRTVREALSREKVGRRWTEIIRDVLQERKANLSSNAPVSIPADGRKTSIHDRLPQSLSESTKPDPQTALSPESAPLGPRPSAPRKGETSPAASRRTRVAILSLLFNWPSTGGGTVHTAETGQFLSLAGYEVRHFYAEFPAWGVGTVTEEPLSPSEPIQFEASSWNAADIQRRFRAAVDDFSPDFVIVTDSWSFKPLLAEAVQGYRYFLRLAALECLCPLNNVRLLVDSQGQTTCCPRHQLATPETCQQCVAAHGDHCGVLHREERALAGFERDGYAERLNRAFAEAEAVLVVNPLIEAMVAPYARQVRVVPSGFAPDRFPWPWPAEASGHEVGDRTRILFAGLVNELMKGFHVVHEACRQLWDRRQDFELVVTGSPPPGRDDEFVRYVGWLSQQELPQQMRAVDIIVVPTVAEEALGRCAVEAMGVGRPVIASRIGGLTFTVSDGATGLLFEPGDAADLAQKIERLLDDPELRSRLGRAGRQRFDDQFTWDVVIARHYRHLLGPAQRPVENWVQQQDAVAT